MNEFTREELEEIIEMANDIELGSQAHGLQMHFKLRDKVISKIHELNMQEQEIDRSINFPIGDLLEEHRKYKEEKEGTF